MRANRCGVVGCDAGVVGRQVESLFNVGLPPEVGEFPADLAALDALLGDGALLMPIEATWVACARDHGRPSMPMDRFVQLMIAKARSSGGCETLLREVSDSPHLRRSAASR